MTLRHHRQTQTIRHKLLKKIIIIIIKKKYRNRRTIEEGIDMNNLTFKTTHLLKQNIIYIYLNLILKVIRRKTIIDKKNVFQSYC